MTKLFIGFYKNVNGDVLDIQTGAEDIKGAMVIFNRVLERKQINAKVFKVREYELVHVYGSLNWVYIKRVE